MFGVASAMFPVKTLLVVALATSVAEKSFLVVTNRALSAEAELPDPGLGHHGGGNIA
jgi:hypothetical protein